MLNRTTGSILSLMVIVFATSFVQFEGNSAAAPEPSIELKSIPYGVLTDYVRAHKGKVIIADVWAEF